MYPVPKPPGLAQVFCTVRVPGIPLHVPPESTCSKGNILDNLRRNQWEEDKTVCKSLMLRQQIFCIFARNPLRLQDAQAVEALRQKLRTSPTILVHSDELQDGIVAAENGTRRSDLSLSYLLCHVCPFFPSPFSKNVVFLFCQRRKICHLTHKTQLGGSTARYDTFSAAICFCGSPKLLRNWCSFQESLGTHRGIVAAGLWCCCLKFTARWGIAASRSRCGAVESTTVQRQFWDEKSSVDLKQECAKVKRSKARGC